MREVCQCAVTERMCACRQREDICRRRSGNEQTTEVGALFKRAVTVLSALCQYPLMTTETLRGERMCANSGRVYGHNVRGLHRQRKEGDNDISDCSEMRTEGTSRPSIGMLSHQLRTERVPCNPCACSARKPAFDMTTVPGRPAGPRKDQRRAGILRVQTACVSRVFAIGSN